MSKKIPGAVRGRPKTGNHPVRTMRIPDDEWSEIKRKSLSFGFKSPAKWIRTVVKMIKD